LKNERGFALIITLLVTALLVALTAEFVNEVYVDTSARQSFVDGQQASLLADSGMTAAVALIKFKLPAQDYTSLTDLTSLALVLQAVDERVKVSIEEESGKLNINGIVSASGEKQVNYAIAERLFKKLGLSPDLLDAVADWIDTNDEPRPSGAETPYYQGLKPPYVAKNAYLETFEELKLIKGFDAKTLELLQPYITVYPDTAGVLTAGIASFPININTARKELIASLSEAMTDELAERIIEYRQTNPLKTASDLGKVAGMESISLSLSTLVVKSSQKGAVFRIISRATVNETVRVIEAVLRDGQSSYLYWREY